MIVKVVFKCYYREKLQVSGMIDTSCIPRVGDVISFNHDDFSEYNRQVTKVYWQYKFTDNFADPNFVIIEFD